MLHSKSTYFYRWSSRYISIAPIACALTLLVGTGLFLNPATKAQEAYAATTSGCQTKPNEARPAYCVMELGIMMNGTNETFTEPSATELKTDATAYREYDFAVRAVDTEDGYKLLAEAVNTTVGEKDYTNQLVNMDDPDNSKLVPLTTATTGASIPSGQWGYAFAKGDAIATTDKTTLEYKAVPTAADTTREIDTGGDTIYDDASNTHTDMNYKLYFGARAADNMRSGHYRTQVLLSVVADAKFIGGLGGITRMSEMTAEACKKLRTPSPTAELKDVPTGQLIDDREDPITGTKYWVSKLADGNCWMTQNMAYDSGGTNSNGQYRVDKKHTALIPDNAASPTRYAQIDIADKTLSDDPMLIDGIKDDTYNAHYLMGNYYTNNTTGSLASAACNFSGIDPKSGWILPTSPSVIDASAENGSFGKLLGAYNITNDKTGVNTLSKPPLYFLFTSRYYTEFSRDICTEGEYWSSTVESSNTYFLSFRLSGAVSPRNSLSNTNVGFPVRCVVSSE